MIVLSSDEAVKELLDRRSGNYSSRPPLYIGQMISGWMRMLLMVRLGLNWITFYPPLPRLLRSRLKGG